MKTEKETSHCFVMWTFLINVLEVCWEMILFYLSLKYRGTIATI